MHSLRIRNATPGPGWSDWFFDAAHVTHGVVDQLGVHGIDLVQQLIGPIADVSARLATQLPVRRLDDGRTARVGVADTAFATYGFVGGATPWRMFASLPEFGSDM